MYVLFTCDHLLSSAKFQDSAVCQNHDPDSSRNSSPVHGAEKSVSQYGEARNAWFPLGFPWPLKANIPKKHQRASLDRPQARGLAVQLSELERYRAHHLLGGQLLRQLRKVAPGERGAPPKRGRAGAPCAELKGNAIGVCAFHSLLYV